MVIEPWTYGAEHEWADWPLDRELPKGFGIDTKDCTIVNSNGIANDPKGKLYRFGGEINTPPTQTIEDQVGILTHLKELYPEAKVNYRSNLHLHIRIPGLIEDLESLKILQKNIHTWMPEAFDVIEPIPEPERIRFRTDEEYKGARRRYRRRCVSHHTLLTEKRLQHQLEAQTIEEFFEREVPRSKKDKPLWHCQPRLCVNLRQLKETDTIEFRHWPGTMDEEQLRNAFEWCYEFITLALFNQDREEFYILLNEYEGRNLPKFPAYEHWMEERYRRTCHDGTLTKEQIKQNIEEILNETVSPMPR